MLILSLPSLGFTTCCNAARHTYNKLLDKLIWYTTPTLLQRLTKAILLFLYYSKVIILCIELIHASLEGPPEVLNLVQIG